MKKNKVYFKVGDQIILRLTPLGKPQKNKVIFFSGPATKALSPPPLELSGNIVLCDFFRASKKVIFLSGQALTPLLVAWPLKKYLYFFAASLRYFKIGDLHS